MGGEHDHDYGPHLAKTCNNDTFPQNAALAHRLEIGVARAAPTHSTHKAQSASRLNDRTY